MTVSAAARVPIGQILSKVKFKQPLSRQEIKSFVGGVVDKSIPQYQVAAWLAFVRMNGLTDQETTWLTLEMAESGDMLDLSAVEGRTVDKHSTGGISDGTSLVIAPLVATFGLKIPMMSGRGLGHTGGTLDKLESIPGFSVDLAESRVVELLNSIGLAMFGQTAQVAPADKILYSLRDVTETVDSIPLIAASIMSKKLAEGTQGLVLNVTTGSGAFMRHFADAKALAQTMVAIAKGAGRSASAVISSMDQPLAPAVGNALEIAQAIRILKGESPPAFKNFIDVVIELSAHMLVHGGLYGEPFEHQLLPAKIALRERLASGQAARKFQEMIAAQGGDSQVVSNPSRLPMAISGLDVTLPTEGFVQAIDSTKVGLAAMYLGAGRETLDSVIDPAAGIIVHKFIGERVSASEPVASLFYTAATAQLERAKETLIGAYQVGEAPVDIPNLILDTII